MMRRFKVKLTAGQLVPLSVTGDYIRVITSAAEFEIQPDTSQNLQGMQAGMAYTAPKTFNELKLTSSVNQDVEIMAGVGRVDDNRTSISGVVDMGAKGETVESVAVSVGTAATLIAAANANRRSVIIQNNESSGEIYVGGSGVTAGTGLKVRAENSLVLDKAPQGEIYAIGSVAAMDVRVLTESD